MSSPPPKPKPSPPAPAVVTPPSLDLITYLSGPRERASQFLEGLEASAKAAATAKQQTVQQVMTSWFPRNSGIVAAVSSCGQYGATSEQCAAATTKLSSSDISAAVVFAAKNSPSFVTQLCSSLEQDAASIEGASAQKILSQASNDFGWYVQRLYPALLAQKFCDATGLAEQHTAISEIVDGFCKNNLHNPQALCAHASALPTYAIVLIALGTLLLGAIVGILLYALWLRHREAQATSFGPSPSYSTSTGTSSSVYQPPSQRAVDLSHGFNTLLNHGDLMPPPQ